MHRIWQSPAPPEYLRWHPCAQGVNSWMAPIWRMMEDHCWLVHSSQYSVWWCSLMNQFLPLRSTRALSKTNSCDCISSSTSSVSSAYTPISHGEQCRFPLCQRSWYTLSQDEEVFVVKFIRFHARKVWLSSWRHSSVVMTYFRLHQGQRFFFFHFPKLACSLL